MTTKFMKGLVTPTFPSQDNSKAKTGPRMIFSDGVECPHSGTCSCIHLRVAFGGFPYTNKLGQRKYVIYAVFVKEEWVKK